MKVIDLLNKIANGEEIPNKITIRNNTLIYNKDHLLNLQDYYYMDDEEDATWKIWWYDLNDEVEIIEKDKEIKKLPPSFYENACLTKQDRDVANKINEIIDKINSMEDK